MAHIYNVLNDIILPDLGNTTSSSVIPNGAQGDIVQFTNNPNNPVFDGGLWYGNQLILNNPPTQTIIGDVIDFNHVLLPARNIIGSVNATGLQPITNGMLVSADNTLALVCDNDGSTTNGIAFLGTLSSGGVVQLSAPNNGIAGMNAGIGIYISEDTDGHYLNMDNGGVNIGSGPGTDINLNSDSEINMYSTANSINVGTTGVNLTATNQDIYLVVNNSGSIEIQNNSLSGTVWLQASNTGGEVNVQAQDNLYIHQTNNDHEIIMSTTDLIISAGTPLPLTIQTDGSLTLKASGTVGTINQVLTSDGTNASWQNQNRVSPDYMHVNIDSVPVAGAWTTINTVIPYDDQTVGGYDGSQVSYGSSISYNNSTYTFTITPGRYMIQIDQSFQADNSMAAYAALTLSGKLTFYQVTAGPTYTKVGYHSERFEINPLMRAAGFLNQHVSLTQIFTVSSTSDYQVWPVSNPIGIGETSVLINHGSCTITRLGDI